MGVQQQAHGLNTGGPIRLIVFETVDQIIHRFIEVVLNPDFPFHAPGGTTLEPGGW